MRRALVLGIALVLAFCGVAEAKKKGKRRAKAKPLVEIQVGEKLNLDMVKESPSFTRAKRLRVVDRGRLLFEGKGLWKEQHVFYLRGLVDGKRQEHQAPIAAYLAAHPDVFPGAEGSGFPKYFVENLISFDSEHKRASFHLRAKKKDADRHFLFHWDLEKKTITRADLLAEEKEGIRYISVKPVTYFPESEEVVCLVQTRFKDEDNHYESSVLALGPKGRREIARLDNRLDLSRIFVEPGGARTLFAEYAELGSEGQAPVGYLVNLASGQVQRFDVPITSYGAAFSPGGKLVYIYSNQMKVIWKIDLASGKKLKQVKVGGGGHALAWGPAGRLMLLAHWGLVFLDPVSLKRRQHYPIKKLFEGHVWIPGSVLTRDQAVLRNGDEVIILQLNATKQITKTK
jgi:hypothetical protein